MNALMSSTSICHSHATPKVAALPGSHLSQAINQAVRQEEQGLDQGREAQGTLMPTGDALATATQTRFGPLKHPLRVDAQVLDQLQACDSKQQLGKRLTMVLKQLAAHGRTSTVKGCRGEDNKGWLRSPLGGGSNGMQYYLWWAPKGNGPVKHLDLGEGEIVIQAIRHHDDHSTLNSRGLDEYFEFNQQELADSGTADSPWTQGQLSFVNAIDPIRVIQGRPGSGKTTVLWRAIETRANERVLYLTWSVELAQQAKAHLDSFAPASVSVEARDFLTLLGELCATDIRRLTLRESREAFAVETGAIHANLLGPWKGREASLFCEVRAFLFGRIATRCAMANTPVATCLSDTDYHQLRTSNQDLDEPAVLALLNLFKGLDKPRLLHAAFPELQAARQAISNLLKGQVPEGLLDFDRIVIDEVQDLTLLEARVLVELCRAIGARRGCAPRLLIAGDEGQTVRPSGFDWGALNGLVGARLGGPKKFQLDENLRCPAKIAAVVDRASDIYASLQKGHRPGKQSRRANSLAVEAQLVHTVCDSVEALAEFLAAMDELEGVVVLCPDDDVTWLPDAVRDLVMLPCEVKGLEYQTVVVLNPGQALAKIESVIGAGSSALDAQEARVMIDQLRVVISRATETLAFIDTCPTSAVVEWSRRLLGQDCLVPYELEDLGASFAEVNLSLEERVITRTREALALVGERPRRAFHRALQAVRLFRTGPHPDTRIGASVRRDAEDALRRIATRLLVQGVPAGVEKAELRQAVTDLLPASGNQSLDCFNAFADWLENRHTSPVAMLECIARCRGKISWLKEAMQGVAQQLRHGIELAASNAETAKAFDGHVEGWLQLTGFIGNTQHEARAARLRAVSCMLENFDAYPDNAGLEAVYGKIDSPDPLVSGRVLEVLGRHAEAAPAFLAAGKPEGAARNWRLAGDLEQAERYADALPPGDAADLKWLCNLQRLIKAKPAKIGARLTVVEQEILCALKSQLV